jgi:hypothetical protein
MRRRLSLALSAVVVTVLAAVPGVSLARGDKNAPPVVVGSERLYVQHVVLTGKAEKPHGDLTGTGSLTICVDKASNTISFNFDQMMVATPVTNGHINRGAAGVSGPVVFAFAPPGMINPSIGEIEWSDSTTAAATTISSLVSNPRGFYVDVHTKGYPNGALRGQLGPWKSMKVQDDSSTVDCGTD